MAKRITYLLTCPECGRNDIDVQLYTVDGTGQATLLTQPLLVCARAACGALAMRERDKVARQLRHDNRLEVLIFRRMPWDTSEWTPPQDGFKVTLGDVTDLPTVAAAPETEPAEVAQ